MSYLLLNKKHKGVYAMTRNGQKYEEIAEDVERISTLSIDTATDIFCNYVTALTGTRALGEAYMLAALNMNYHWFGKVGLTMTPAEQNEKPMLRGILENAKDKLGIDLSL